ncbi:hypothetical protein BABINDRAFT_10169 [Babjeviella inositovora NRRL Y-12698]|uniref:Translocon-associated protein subunit alpha n=1 Tax=Babjeviella inositovora NRRL Y-12698 TaxID=984486 RepID=A0A1E3QIR8_9ASCO|nr:uncharacterized protein BABINDRAFT_10169 [Babjeviella inositovora NRRL Y-12698]ODQ77540.1 hypothetical protein BABINDRAFT_10169 [Babjeviella inositovora NRRL Y-12698]
MNTSLGLPNTTKMKLSLLTSFAIALASFARAADSEEPQFQVRAGEDEAPRIPGMDPKVAAGMTGEYADLGSRQPFQFKITYSIEEFPEADESTVVELFNGEEITLSYEFTNNEDEEASVVGVGGSFLDPKTQEIVSNITDTQLGPLSVGARESVVFRHKINPNFDPGNYVLNPVLYVLYNNGLMMVGSRPQFVSLKDRYVSWFNPQFLMVILFLLSSTAAVGFYGYQFYQSLVAASTTKKAKKTFKVTAKAAASGVAKKGQYDEAWIPEGHLKKTKKSN